jgi:hypothetical protein
VCTPILLPASLLLDILMLAISMRPTSLAIYMLSILMPGTQAI